MAMKKISEFPTSTPASTDKILFEKDGRGRCTTVSSLLSAGFTEFTEGVPAGTDTVLFGNNGVGKRANINSLYNAGFTDVGFSDQSVTVDIGISEFKYDGVYLIVGVHANLSAMNSMCIIQKKNGKLGLCYKNSDSIVVSSDMQTLTFSCDWYNLVYAKLLGTL